jgi:hypothetical protein
VRAHAHAPRAGVQSVGLERTLLKQCLENICSIILTHGHAAWQWRGDIRVVLFRPGGADVDSPVDKLTRLPGPAAIGSIATTAQQGMLVAPKGLAGSHACAALSPTPCCNPCAPCRTSTKTYYKPVWVSQTYTAYRPVTIHVTTTGHRLVTTIHTHTAFWPIKSIQAYTAYKLVMAVHTARVTRVVRRVRAFTAVRRIKVCATGYVSSSDAGKGCALELGKNTHRLT